VRQAYFMRNIIMNAMRGQTFDFGLALTRFMEKEGNYNNSKQNTHMNFNKIDISH